MFKQKDDSRHRKFGTERADEVAVNCRCSNISETSRNRLEDLDGVLAVGPLPVAGIEPRRYRENDDNERVPEDRHKEEPSSYWICVNKGSAPPGAQDIPLDG